MQFVKREGKISDQKKIQYMEAKTEQLEARLDYVSMMADIDLDEEGGEEDDQI
jgi:hypothetical protein